MISPELRKTLQDIKGTQYGRALKEYLNLEMDKLKDLSLNPPKSWEETLGRIQADMILRQLLDVIDDNKPNPKKTSYQ